MAILVAVLLSAAGGTRAVAARNFPTYATIRDNVRFWEKIYGTYSLRDAVIHDQEDLSKIYSVLKLKDDSEPGAETKNRNLQKRGVEKYRNLLLRLARSKPSSREEKRIAAMFPKGKSGRRAMARAAKNIRIQTGQKERFRRGVIRSGAYMKEIKSIFLNAGLPEDLAYLPHVESSFHPKAHSKFGAAGIWQFTRATGKQYLRIDDAVDERLDPIIATRAAAAYLKNSYGELRSWPLAITSYNYGLAGMIRAVEAVGSYERIFDNYRQGHFKFASQNFYSEFLAARTVAKKLEKSGRLRLDSPRPHHYMTLHGYTSLATLSIHFGLSPETIKDLNPALRPPIFRGEKYLPRGYRLRLPGGKTILSKIRSFPASYYRNRQRPSRYHRVRPGDTAGGIARKYGIPLKELIRANNLDRYATIYVRQKLKLPGLPSAAGPELGSTSRVTYIQARKKTFSDNRAPGTQRAKNKKILLADKKKIKFSPSRSPIPARDLEIYEVKELHRKNGVNYGWITAQPEESLELLSSWLKTSDKELRQLNNLGRGEQVGPGQRLLLAFRHVGPESFVDKRLDFLQETEDDFFTAYRVEGQKHYRVQPGDTLWELCHTRFEIPLWLLGRYNPGIDLSRLRINQQLIVPIVRPI